MRECFDCGRDLPFSEFYRSNDSRDGCSSYCRQCLNARHKMWKTENADHRRAYNRERSRRRDREELNAAARARRTTEAGKRATLHGRLRQDHGISLAEYEDMVARQHGLCAICMLPPGGESFADRRLHVDHDHASGRIRGLLCRYCNMGVGLLRDDPEIIAAAIAYLDAAAQVVA